MIVFIGDRPSSNNKYPNVPFVGTRSFEVLKTWVKQLAETPDQLGISAAQIYSLMDRDVVYMNIKIDSAHGSEYASMSFLYNSQSLADKLNILTHHTSRPQDSFIALGNNASKRLIKLDIPHFKLPHPSPSNRLLNDPTFIVSELNKLKKWLHSSG